MRIKNIFRQKKSVWRYEETISMGNSRKLVQVTGPVDNAEQLAQKANDHSWFLFQVKRRFFASRYKENVPVTDPVVEALWKICLIHDTFSKINPATDIEWQQVEKGLWMPVLLQSDFSTRAWIKDTIEILASKKGIIFGLGGAGMFRILSQTGEVLEFSGEVTNYPRQIAGWDDGSEKALTKILSRPFPNID